MLCMKDVLGWTCSVLQAVQNPRIGRDFAEPCRRILNSQTDRMDPARYKRPRNGPRTCKQHPKSEEGVRDGSYNDRNRLGKECVRG